MKLFVWDLHGTLEQGNEQAVIELSNQVLARFGHVERFDDSQIRQLYGAKWYQYFETLLPGLDHEQCLELQAACFEVSNSPEGIELIANHMKPSLHAKEVLAAIAASVHEQVLISNTVPESLPTFIEALGMQQYFDVSNSLAVNGHIKTAGITKHSLLTEYLKGRLFDDYVVIGDSNSDMELAQLIGGKGYLYAHIGLEHRSTNGTRIDDLARVLAEI